MSANFEDVVEAIKKLPTNKNSYTYDIPSGTGAVSVTTNLLTKYPGKEVEIISVEAKWSAAPTTSENFTVTLQRGGTSSVVVFSIDPSSTSLTSLLHIWDEPYVLQSGDEVIIAYTNTDAKTIAGRLIVRPRT